MGDNGAIAPPLGNNCLRGVVTGIHIDVGHVS